MSEVRLVAEPRTEFGKGAARRVRRAHKVPAVLYGHGEKPRHVSLPGHDLMIALRRDPNVLLTLSLDGADELALPRAVVRDPIKGHLEHLDLLLVRRGEKVTIELPLTVTGELARGALPEVQLQTLSVEADATKLPTGVEVSVDGLEVGDHIIAGQITLPAGTTLITDPEALVLSVQASPTAAELEAVDEALEVEAAEAAEAEAASGEATGEGDVVPDSDSDAGGPGGAPAEG